MVSRISRGLVPLALLVLVTDAHDARNEDRSGRGNNNTSTATVCEARTINYITHTLPQLCLTSTWRSAIHTYNESTATASPTLVESSGLEYDADDDAHTTIPTGLHTSATETETETHDAEATVEAPPTEAVASPFMSFEDWKEIMLRRTGQDPQDLRSRKATSGEVYERIPPDMGHFELGEEDEISLDFNNYLRKTGSDPIVPSGLSEDRVFEDREGDTVVYESDERSLHRSKDAGKTCKERFSYSSFDAGATVLKTGRGTKNAKAILVENKDSYMLLECSVDSKYVIVELSDDILIDTVVLANFEFFSSMVRQFRVSVSDRYPVKMDRWRDIGTFEARNSRDIQAFLVKNPQIWAKYVRIEFLSHYGNEYYCPVSLLRIHGSRMLDSWKETETGREEEISILDDDGTETTDAENDSIESAEPGLLGVAEEPATSLLNFTSWASSPFDSFNPLYGTCRAGTLMADEALHPKPNASEEIWDREAASDKGRFEDDPAVQSLTNHQSSNWNEKPPSPSAVTALPTSVPCESRPTTKVNNSTSTNTTISTEGVADHSTPATKASTPVSPGAKHRSTGTSSASTASPTVQEGFFNAITKRLHHVESNLTLSLQYLDDHSRYMQEALQNAEQKQLSKVTIFLENLNQTVLAELRGMRDQYEQIWQSTVIALESQKEQSDRDIVALSSRLNLLADEVVFQKRMAIVQAVLLLCCLFLVIFSRGVPIPYLAPLLDQNGPSTDYPVPQHSNFQSNGLFSSESSGSPPRDTLVAHRSNGYGNAPSLDGTTAKAPTGDCGPLHPPATSCAASTECGNEGLTHAHPSPPSTPLLQPDSSLSDPAPPAPGFELQSPSSRRLQPYQHTQSRKPLPALPEHPIS